MQSVRIAKSYNIEANLWANPLAYVVMESLVTLNLVAFNVVDPKWMKMSCQFEKNHIANMIGMLMELHKW